MWRIRRAAACSSSLHKWWSVEKNAARCSPCSEHMLDFGAAFSKRCFSRALLPPGSSTNYGKGLSFSCRGFASKHDSASDLSESDEFEEPESSSGLKEIEDEPEEAKAEDENEEHEEDDDAVSIKPGGDWKSDKRLAMVQTDKLEQELLTKVFALKREDSAVAVVEKWKQDGKDLTPGMIVTVMNRLKMANRLTHAMEVIDWVVEEPDYKDFKLARSFQLEITARSKGIAAAEKLFEELPDEEKTRPVYNALLSRYVFLHNSKKAETTFEEMEKAGFVSQSPFALNLMMKLYKRKGENAKFQEILEKAKDVSVEPNIFTYNVMLELKAKSGDIDGMEKIFAEMKNNSSARPDGGTYLALCRGYTKAGLTDKAENCLLRLEVGPFRRTKATFELLMLGYGQLGLVSDVERMWQRCKTIPGDGFNSFVVFQRAMALAGDVSRVESMFNHMEKWKRTKNVEQKRYNNLLMVFYKKGMRKEWQELEKKMADMDIKVTLTESDKELLKAPIPAKAAAKRDKEKESQIRKALEEAAESADVKAAEKAFEKCKQANIAKVGVWNKLLRAYVNAEVPAYGFVQRMKADNVEPNSETEGLLKKLQVEA